MALIIEFTIALAVGLLAAGDGEGGRKRETLGSKKVEDFSPGCLFSCMFHPEVKPKALVICRQPGLSGSGWP